jgi:hypothetical protein
MKKRSTWICAVIASGMWLLPAQALCDGYGFYSWGRGWPKLGVADSFLGDLAPSFEDVKVDLRYDHFAFGYLYDGASTTDQRFGWRFNLGVDIALVNLEGTDGALVLIPDSGAAEDTVSKLFNAVGVGFTTKLTYGIRILHTDKLRFWAGPSAALTVNYLIHSTTSLETEWPPYGKITFEATPWGASLALGGGLETGIRYAVSREVTLDFSTGFLYNFSAHYMDLRSKLNVGGQRVEMQDASFFIGQEPYVFVQLAVRFDLKMAGD